MAVAIFDRLSYWYPAGEAPALADVRVELGGGLTLVMGDSGGGKSTFLRVLNALVPRFHGGRIAGSACVAGLPVPGTPTAELARRVGFVFQDPELQSVYTTVERDVAFGLENLGLARIEMVDRVDAALEAVGLRQLRTRTNATLSGGERQRAALAGALALRPLLLVLDEPTSQLDPDGARSIVDHCLELARTETAVVLAEHRLERLAPAASRILAVENARVHEKQPVLLANGIARRHPATGGKVVWRLQDVAAGPGRENVLEGVDLAGCAGQALALTGPNGGGKTTLLRVIAGLLRPRAGSVERRPGRVAYLPQNPAALLHLASVRAEVELTLRRSGSEEAAGPILARLGLTEVAGRYPRDLSTGERQRAALAAVLAGRPALALLDEPTRGTDVPARTALAGLVADLKESGAAVVIATHDERLIAAAADRVVRVGEGSAREEAAV